MRILALEFSTACRSVALAEEGRVLSAAHEDRPQASGPVALIRDVLGQAHLQPADVNCVAVGTGPGSYTGIRVAIALAQGWEIARGVRILGVSSVECLVWQAWLEGWHGEVVTLVDAQRGEFYAARYRVSLTGVELTTPLGLHAPQEVAAWATQGAMLIGPDLEPNDFAVRCLRPQAAMLAVLASERTDFVPGAELRPVYLRPTQFVKAPPARVIPPIPARVGEGSSGC